jgi:UDP-N-acetylglucosamine--N-acetylmuramyl-(pentapeptide) pyrophosphoryl-undecaprenol N-acetylglucosamine transferase
MADSPFSRIATPTDRVLWVVSSGGHLVQALLLEAAIGVNPDSAWITNDVPQARSLLAGRDATFVPYVAPRDLRGAIRASRTAITAAKRMSPDRVLSTGAAIAGVALPRLALRGYSAAFIESLARKNGHSATGRIAALAPRVGTFTQYESAADDRWTYDGTVLSLWEAAAPRETPPDRGLRIVVALGTIRPYRFDRAVDAVLGMLRDDDDVVWQLGTTTRDDLPGEVHSEMPNRILVEKIAEADVVITHAGVGSIIDSLEHGKAPLLAIRRAAQGEHVDDHQLDIAGEIEERGLGRVLDLSAPSREQLLTLAETRVSKRQALP